MPTTTPFPVQSTPDSPAWAPRSGAPPAGRSFVCWALRPTLAAVPQVRAYVRAVLEGWQVAADLADALILIVSELAANAVQHAGAATDRLRVAVTLGEGWLLLEVVDGDPCLPRFGLEAGPDEEGGRGLMVVGLVLAEAGGEMVALPRGSGKVVSVRIPVV